MIRLTESATHFVRPMQADDVPQAVEIDQECFPTLWPPTPFKRDLSNALARYMVAVEKYNHASSQEAPQPLPPPSAEDGAPVIALGKRLFTGLLRFFPGASGATGLPSLNHDEKIAGLVGLWYMVDEAHITTIGVRESCRSGGIGELLLISAIDLATERNAEVVTLEVRASNQTAQALYEKCGFRRVGLRKAYYTDNREDAVIMTTERITSAPFTQRLERLKEAYLERWGQARAPSQPPPRSAPADSG